MATTFGGVQRFRIGVRLGPGTITAEPDPAQVDEGTIVEWCVTPDSIDPVLRRLERQGWIRSEWKNSGNKAACEVLCTYGRGAAADWPASGNIGAGFARRSKASQILSQERAKPQQETKES